jgi:(p)ppGpp synthase/HD superfamily hydrolase
MIFSIVCLKQIMENLLEQVKQFAANAHGSQRRKFIDEPYIAHPIRVMELCKEYTTDTAVLAAALLHDVLEDTPVSKEEIQHFLSTLMNASTTERTVRLVDELTDRFIKANYPQWNRRVRKSKEAERLTATSADAQTIKYADIIDNSAEFASQENDFAEVFLRECNALLKKMNKGNAELRQRALKVVEEELEKLK